jgi:hypothetical protein
MPQPLQGVHFITVFVGTAFLLQNYNVVGGLRTLKCRDHHAAEAATAAAARSGGMQRSHHHQRGMSRMR